MTLPPAALSVDDLLQRARELATLVGLSGRFEASFPDDREISAASPADDVWEIDDLYAFYLAQIH